MIKKQILIVHILFVVVFTTAQPKPIYLWKDVVGMKHQHTRLYIYPAPDSIATGVGIIICPGGSYHHLGMPHEGYQVAEWLNSQGISAYVLRYRVGMFGNHHPAMIQDLQRTIQFVREHKDSFHLQTMGVMGFSAGGHLVTMAGACYKTDYLEKLGIHTTISLRPDFVVPVYPVVSMQDSLAHIRSRKNLLGCHYTKQEMDAFSMELQIPADMPPVFLVTAKDDPVVNFHNSIELDKALKNKNINHEFLLYETGGHGYGMSVKRGGETAKWNVIFKQWLIDNKFIK